MPARLAELGSGIAPLVQPAAAPQAATPADPTNRLGQLRGWLAATQAVADPHEPRRARLVHVGGGRGCPDAAAELAQLSVREVPGTLTAGPVDQLATGIALADAEVDTGTDLLVLSLPGAQILGPAAISVITGTEPVKLLPRGARLTVAEWTQRAVAVRDARRVLLGAGDDPDELLAAACELAADHATSAGADVCHLAVTCGLLLQATARRTPVVLDGVGAAAAAALCAQAAPNAPAWWRAAELGADPAYDAAVAHAAVETVLPVAAGGPPGVAGALAVLTLRLAVRAVAS